MGKKRKGESKYSQKVNKQLQEQRKEAKRKRKENGEAGQKLETDGNSKQKIIDPRFRKRLIKRARQFEKMLEDETSESSKKKQLREEFLKAWESKNQQAIEQAKGEYHQYIFLQEKAKQNNQATENKFQSFRQQYKKENYPEVKCNPYGVINKGTQIEKKEKDREGV